MELKKCLEVITKVSLIPAREYLQEQLLTAEQGAKESIGVYIDRLQHMDSKLGMISNDPTAVHNSLTMKLFHSVHSDYAMAVTMIKNIFHTAYLGATNSQRWLYVASALREAEQVHICAAAEMQHGYSAVPRRPRGQSTECGFNNYGASSSG